MTILSENHCEISVAIWLGNQNSRCSDCGESGRLSPKWTGLFLSDFEILSGEKLNHPEQKIHAQTKRIRAVHRQGKQSKEKW